MRLLAYITQTFVYASCSTVAEFAGSEFSKHVPRAVFGFDAWICTEKGVWTHTWNPAVMSGAAPLSAQEQSLREHIR